MRLISANVGYPKAKLATGILYTNIIVLVPRISADNNSALFPPSRRPLTSSNKQQESPVVITYKGHSEANVGSQKPNWHPAYYTSILSYSVTELQPTLFRFLSATTATTDVIKYTTQESYSKHAMDILRLISAIVGWPEARLAPGIL